MRTVILWLFALLLATLQHANLTTWSWAPDLTLALAAWAVVDGTEDGVLLRAWLVGLARDLIDPCGTCFHTVAYFLLALAFLPMRNLIFRGRGLGWFGWAMAASLLLALVDRWISGAGDPPARDLAVALATGLATLPIGWALGALPGPLHPIGRGGA